MRTELIFFDNSDESFKGILRGLIAIITLISCDMIWFKILDYEKEGGVTKKVNIISALISWVLICCSISVQLPKSFNEALIYGMLCGLVIYGVFNSTNFAINKDWSLKLALLDTIWGITVCAIASSVVYFVFHKNNI